MQRLGVLLCLVYVLGSKLAFGSLQDYPVNFQVRREGTIAELVARNDGPSTISAHLTISGSNIASDKTWPINVTVQRHSSQVIARLWPLASDRPIRFSYNVTHHFGDAEAKHGPNERYRLPFEDGKAFPVGQAYGGVLTTHNDKESQYAFDFTMPEGTVVVAARAGIVVDVTMGHSAGAKDISLLEKANSVIVLHDDGTIAEYAHLAPRQAMVDRGQRVAVGDRLAYSGNTGFSSGPHLHFAVSRPEVSQAGVMRQIALPIIFFTHNPPTPLVPKQGELVSAIYDRPWDASGGAEEFAGGTNRKEANAASNDASVPRSLDLPQTIHSIASTLWQSLVLKRTGIVTWGWIVVLVLIWLFVRARRKPADLRMRFDREDPTIARIDANPDVSLGNRSPVKKQPPGIR